MEKVLGVGGVFFKARNPVALRAWYRDHLGVPIDEWGGTFFEDNGPFVWSVFEPTSTYLGSGAAPFMINYRVRDLDAMLAQLRAAGCAVDDKVQDEGYGRFGWVTDPEGNRVELWQPTEPSSE
jgi:predicted enzyme related to lactoylglutathione lyase